MKISELKALTVQELEERLEQTSRNLYQLRVRATFKELENTAEIRAERRNVARIKQMLADKQRQAAAQAQ